MFDGYSIADASRPHDLDEGFIMDDDVSPTSSRTSTPAPEGTTLYDLPPDMDLVTDLSSRFKYQSLESRRHDSTSTYAEALTSSSFDLEPPPPRPRSSRRRSSSLLVWQQRQALARRQCNPAHLSQISALVEELSHNSNACYSSAHPSSGCQSPVSRTSDPSSPISFDSNPSSSGSEDYEIEVDTFSPSEAPPMARVDKAWRRGTSIEALERKQKLVLKKVRMRKSLVRLKANA
ncbi:MAG: hypothetical protein Q9218_000377 [Villophora microphyllina]